MEKAAGEVKIFYTGLRDFDWLQFSYSPLKRGYGKNRNPL